MTFHNQTENKTNKRASVQFALILLLTSVTVDALYRHLVINLTQSLPQHVFWLIDADAEQGTTTIEKGGYAVFEFTHPKIDKPLVKQVACNQGDVLTHKDGRFYCNGQFLARAKRGNLGLTRFEFDGVIPDGQFFAMGTHPDSFDSRYFGLVASNRARAVKPLF